MDDQRIVFEGTPAQIGSKLGSVWGQRIKDTVDAFYSDMDQAGVKKSDLQKPVDSWQRGMMRRAPHMLEEIESIAKAASVDKDRFMTYTACKYVRPERTICAKDRLLPIQECTSFLAIGKASGMDANLVHKNRDAWMVPQSVRIVHVQGKHRWIGAGDVAHIGCCHVLNEAGLAIKTNTGSAIEAPVEGAFCTTIVLRHLAEECENCEQALERLQDLCEQRRISNGTSGCIWLMADRKRGLLVEEKPGELHLRWVDDDVEARQNDFRLDAFGPVGPRTKRYALAIDTMHAWKGFVCTEDMNRLGRSTLHYPESICHDTTNSATTSIIPFDPMRVPYWQMAVGHPNHTLHIPMSPCSTGLPTSLVNGEFWLQSKALFDKADKGAPTDLMYEPIERAFCKAFLKADDDKKRAEVTERCVNTAASLLQAKMDAAES